MFSLWNYSATRQDIVLTFRHQEGKRGVLIHLEACASMTLTVGKLIGSGAGHATQNVAPLAAIGIMFIPARRNLRSVEGILVLPSDVLIGGAL